MSLRTRRDVTARRFSRAGNVRLSFHLYNTEEDVDAALDALYA
jgi:selenocysteine lyase/cysteine desulfurase